MSSDSAKGLTYIRWDRTDAEAQSIEALGTFITGTTYLTDAAKDRAGYFKATFNDTTKAVTVQAVSIEKQRVAVTPAFGCYTMYATGTLGASVRVGKTADAFNANGHSVSLAAQDGLAPNWDYCEATDTTTFANGSGNGTTVEGFTMNYSCDDVNTLGATGKAFDGNTVNFALTKTDVDAMFGAN